MTIVDGSRVAELTARLTPRQRVAALARVLHAEGYRDHATGHITYKQDDGTFLVNPFELSWDEVRPEDIMRMDADGAVVDGPHTVTPAITLHVEAHRARPDAVVVVHGHPEWATAWAAAQRIPPIFDQTSAMAGDHVALYDEYGGSVEAAENARGAVAALGSGRIALLSNHGVFVVAASIEEAYLCCSTVEWRSRRAAQVTQLGGGAPLRSEVVEQIDRYVRAHEAGLPMFASDLRRVLRQDPTFLSGDRVTSVPF